MLTVYHLSKEKTSPPSPHPRAVAKSRSRHESGAVAGVFLSVISQLKPFHGFDKTRESLSGCLLFLTLQQHCFSSPNKERRFIPGMNARGFPARFSVR